MEKFSQFRDRGSGVAPFLPSTTPLSLPARLLHFTLFVVRLLVFLPYAIAYFILLQHLPLPTAIRKLLAWGLLFSPGIWWVDLQLDGVRRGALAAQPKSAFPHPGSVVAANFTSPVDAVYLSAVFDPVFVECYPGSKLVRRIGLWRAVVLALAPVLVAPPRSAAGKLTNMAALCAKYPDRVICLFPECGTTNGKAILPLSPALVGVPADVHIFPVSIRYTPADVTTPVPGQWLRFLWDLLSQTSTCIRVRVAQSTMNTSAAATNGTSSAVRMRTEGAASARGAVELTGEEQRVLDRVAEALARLCRNKRVGLTLEDKTAFVDAWNGRKKR